ncbi:MAG: NAD(P)-dependent oxidoreductase [Candidatus Eremiobacteraeota bacterium]|nr:NAD(P)-dependent oxidoreductase [Candidatus Eremiobacteraeota bacterium]
MNILFSGASSFTGHWFGRALADEGHRVLGLFRKRSAAAYEETRRRRVETTSQLHECAFDCTFGEKRFLEIIRSHNWDVYCHHASDVTDYRSPAFDPIAATRNNTLNLKSVLDALEASGCTRVIFTGSVFESGEGQGGEGLRAFSRYGVSKRLSWEIFLFECHERGLQLEKFVIPNPFGPLEEPRFTSFLANTWKDGRAATCHTPLYVRDNIPVDLLALEYGDFVQDPETRFCYPSGYIESQGRFTERVAAEFRARTSWDCRLEPTEQSDFSQPLIRVNSQPSQIRQPDWDEKRFWDDMVEFYRAP